MTCWRSRRSANQGYERTRERQIKGLKTRVHNLTAELHYVRALGSDAAMSFATMSAIAKALHPDREPSAAERGHAMKLFTEWKARIDKLARRPKN
jgi:hypothetical protein